MYTIIPLSVLLVLLTLGFFTHNNPIQLLITKLAPYFFLPSAIKYMKSAFVATVETPMDASIGFGILLLLFYITYTVVSFVLLIYNNSLPAIVIPKTANHLQTISNVFIYISR